MARAFGDFCLKDFGLISVPDISYRHLTEKDEFIVLATDGVRAVLILRSFSVYCIVYEISLLSLINGIFCCFDLF
jgi:serine/threonine protein phosphatase PrpC